MKVFIDKQTLAAITSVGLAATVAQLAVLRELLVLFYGIELFIGLVLVCWLLWNGLGCSIASRLAPHLQSTKPVLGALLSITAVILPGTLFFIRIARSLWHIEPGELPSMGSMLGICILSTSLPSVISGALFGLCWVFSGKISETSPNKLPLPVYMGEAIGAAIGGICFYIFFGFQQPIFTAIWSVSLILLLVSGWILLSRGPYKFVSRSGLIWLTSACIVVYGALFREEVEQLSRKLQWGSDLIAVKDTAFQNLSVIKTDQQYSVFSNGLWRYSTPDKLSEEYAVHPALLQHPNPQSVLILGGNGAHFAAEALKHNETLRVDVIELDPMLFEFDKAYVTASNNQLLHNPRITIHHQDAARFIYHTNQRYQVILMNLGDPINAQMNRFFTESFFSHIKKKLSPDGIFSLSVSGGEDMLGEDQIIFLKSIFQTLQNVFPKTFILPGERIQFFSAGNEGHLLRDHQRMADRLRHRSLSLSYVRPDTLQYLLAPFRLKYFNSVLKDTSNEYVNTDFSPLCYQRALRLLAAQWHPPMKQALDSIMKISLPVFWSILLFLGGIITAIYFPKKNRISSPVYMAVGVAGGVTLALQMVLLLVFQIVMGLLYLHMVVLIAAFMVGLAIGAGWISMRHSRLISLSAIKKQFIIIQTLLFLYPLCLAVLFLGVHQFFQENLFSSGTGLFFTILSLVAGIIGGLHFSSATALMHASENHSIATGGYLYAVDLVGAASGVLLTTLFLIPILGPLQTLPVLSFAVGICLLILVRRLLFR
jgi:spermidine synthase